MRDQLQRRLEACAALYFRYKDIPPPIGEQRAALNEIASLASRLAERLDNLDRLVASYLWREDNSVWGYVSVGKPSPHGHTFRPIELADGRSGLYRLEIEDLIEAVHILASYGRHGRTRYLAEGRAGRGCMHCGTGRKISKSSGRKSCAGR